MTTKKSNFLTYIIVFALLIFIIVFIWNKTRVDNSEPISVVTAPVNKPKIKQPQRTQHIEQEIISPETQVDKAAALKKKRKAYRENVKKSMNQALMLKTPESIMNVIIHYQSAGDDEKANEYIELLLKKFPDYDMDF